MREIKFDYIVKSKDGTEVFHCPYTLGQIQDSNKLTDIELSGRIVAKRQFTSLHDKNGVEIYDGDILEFDDYYFEGIGNGGTGYSEWRRKRREVRFENGMFTVGQDHALAMLIRDARVEDERYEFEDDEKTGWEVIGNVYENAELLKEV